MRSSVRRRDRRGLSGVIGAALVGAASVAAFAQELHSPVAAGVDGGVSRRHKRPKAGHATHHLNLTPPPINGTTLPPQTQMTVTGPAEKVSRSKAAATENAAAAPVPVRPDEEPKLRTTVGDFGMMRPEAPDDTRREHPTGLANPPADLHAPTIPFTITFQPGTRPSPDAGEYGLKMVPKQQN